MNEFITEKVKNELKEYNLKLSETGVDCIVLQTELIYGKNPTDSQIREVVGQNTISFLNHKKAL